MIVLAGEFSIDPAKRDEALPILKEMMDATNRDEAGCIMYRFYPDAWDASIVHVYEEWESQEALDAHGKTPHMEKYRAAMAGIRTDYVNIRIYEAERKN